MGLDDYKLLRKIGSGGAGLTYLVSDQEGIQRCMKEFRFGMKKGEEGAFKARELFEREAKTLRSLNHPQIPKYLDFFIDDSNGEDKLYLIMEYIPGDTLEDLLNKQKFNESDSIEFAKKVTNVLEYLHSFSPPIIHRDVKPRNLIKTSEGIVKLIDFGSVADKIMSETKFTFTRVGTFGFSAPELGYDEPCPASDIYSLGVTLVYLLSGGINPVKLMNNRHRIDFKGKLNVSKRTENLLWDMTEPDLDKRISNTEELRQRLYGGNGSDVILKPSDILSVEYKDIKGGYAKFWHRRWSLQEIIDKIEEIVGKVQDVCHDYGREIEVKNPLEIKAKKESQDITAGSINELEKSLPSIREQKRGIYLVTYRIQTTDNKIWLDFTYRNSGFEYKDVGDRKSGLIVNFGVKEFTHDNRREHDELRLALGKLKSDRSFDNTDYDYYL